MQKPRRSHYDAVVIGAGLIGLACAWRARRLGMSVLVVEREDAPGAATSAVAAGMLAPVPEADFGEEAALRLNLLARERWPAFAAELEELTGLPTGFRETGTLIVAADRDDAEALHRLHDLHRSLGLPAEWLTPSRCRELEPALSPRVGGGILASQDAQAEPAALARALAAGCEEIVLGQGVAAIEQDGGRVSGVRLADGAVLECEHVVIAAGPWSAALAPEGAGPPVRPVKGQILELRARGGASLPFTRMIRTPRCYLVGRRDGSAVLGATVEEQGFDATVTADGVFRLLEAAWEVLPEVGELELVAARAGLRPATPDNLPLIGADELDGLIWATGHWRGGVLLAPLTGEAVAALLAGDPPPAELDACSPARFARAHA